MVFLPELLSFEDRPKNRLQRSHKILSLLSLLQAHHHLLQLCAHARDFREVGTQRVKDVDRVTSTLR